MKFNQVDLNLLNTIANLTEVPDGAVNIRKDGQPLIRMSSSNIIINPKADKPGIDIIIKPGTKDETVHIPVIVTQAGLQDLVYNTFEIGQDADVTIIAGCGIHNDSHKDSGHDGVHEFIIKANARVRYVEKHYGGGSGTGKKVLNPTTIIRMGSGAYAEMEMVQIEGVDDTYRKTLAYVEDGAHLYHKHVSSWSCGFIANFGKNWTYTTAFTATDTFHYLLLHGRQLLKVHIV
jgi:hypothetical protein